jgi:N-methylhydantoinase A
VSGRNGTWIVGCDTGGTFTDVFALSAEGEARVAKVPSTPPHFDVGVVEGVEALVLEPGDVGTLFHGTTVTTNAVITKTGAPTALVTTQGFRDVLEIRRANREELYDILWDPPPPLVPRRHRLEVVERVDYGGGVVTALDEESVRDVARKIRARNLASVGVCLINAHMNPAHERRVREILLEELPGLDLSLSTDILPEPPEFERTATTVANAYCAPVLRRYMDALEERLAEGGYGRDVVLVMHNGGGTMTTDYAKGVAVKTLNSGPAAGVIAGAAVAASAGRQDVVCLDMGGTSADIGVVLEGRPRLTTSFDLEWGMPIRFPSIDVISIGAGGGSIAWLDPAGYPRSGPQSAGADPGPACYGRGGTEPTNTDAHLVLGRVSNDLFLEGRMELDVDLAREAIRRRIAEPLGLSVEEAAEGILRIANANMVEAIRLVTIERGYDPRELSLVAFGGAGPLHALDLAAELQMPEVVVPPYPGVTSAMGLLHVDPLDDFSWAYVQRREQLDLDHLAGVYREMEERVVSSLERQGVDRADIAIERLVDLRYIGQLHSVTVPLPEITDAGVTGAVTAFHDEHLRQYRYSHPDAPVETSTLRVAARGTRQKPDLRTVRYAERDTRNPSPDRERPVHFGAVGWLDTKVVDRLGLAAGDEVEGPCVVEELDSTLVLAPGMRGRVDEVGNIVITLERNTG